MPVDLDGLMKEYSIPSTLSEEQRTACKAVGLEMKYNPGSTTEAKLTEIHGGARNLKCKPICDDNNTSRLIPGTSGKVSGGDSCKLGKNMMKAMNQNKNIKWSGYQAQHIIPAEMANHPVLQKIGMDLDDASNGIFLKVPSDDVSAMSRHRGYHSVYNEFVKSKLDAISLNQSISEIQEQIYKLQNNLRKLQQNGLPLYPSQGATLELWQRAMANIE